MSRLNNLYLFLNDEKGRTLPRAKLFFYENESFDFKPTYADKALTAINPNPVIADGAGRFPNIFLEADTYRVVLQDEDGVEISTKDDVDNLLSDGDNISNTTVTTSTGSQTVAGALDDRIIKRQDVAAAVATDASIGTVIKTNTYAGVNGGNWYEVVAGATGTDDGGSFIDMSNGNQLKALFPYGIQLEQFGLLASNTGAQNKVIVDKAIVYLETISGVATVGPGSFPTSGGHQILSCRIEGAGMQKTVWLYNESEPECFVVGGSTLGAFQAGSGVEKFTVRNNAIGDFTGMRYSSCSHAKVYDVECEDFDAANGIGHLWQNEGGRWTETGWYLGLKATNCMKSYKHRQNSGDPGTNSQAYNRLSGTVSSMPVGGIGQDIDDGIIWYGCDTDLNIYMDGDATSIGVQINGELNHGRALYRGEKPGGGLHTCWKMGSTAKMREQKVHAVFENGAIDIDWVNATIANNRGEIISVNDNEHVTFDIKPSLGARLTANEAIVTAAWDTLTGWTELLERPSGANNFASGIFTAPQDGLYQFNASVAFTPAATDRCAIRISSTAGDFVLAQDIAETADDLILSGLVTISLDEGDTAELQAYTTNAAGDTIRASDADGFKTTFGYNYLSR